MPKITISFKHNKEDLELYNEIMRHSDRSAYVKDIMKGHTSKKEETKEPEDDLLIQLKQFKF
jgi:hypothetical protein